MYETSLDTELRRLGGGMVDGDGQGQPAAWAAQSCVGKVAVVTGGSRGIGQAIALRFAAEGAKVALLGRGTSTRRTDLSGSLEEGLDRIAAVGGDAIALHADLDAPEWDASELGRQITREFGRSPDILIHSAAAPREWGSGWLTKFTEMTFDCFQRSVLTNVWGGWRMAQAVVPGMRAQGGGNIVMISSSAAAPAPLPTMQAHAAHMAFNGGGALYGGTKAFLDRVAGEVRLAFDLHRYEARSKLLARIRLLLRARDAHRQVMSGDHRASLFAIGNRSKYLVRLARLNDLAPDIVTALIEGRQSASLNARRLSRISNLPLGWDEQRRCSDSPSCELSAGCSSDPNRGD